MSEIDPTARRGPQLRRWALPAFGVGAVGLTGTQYPLVIQALALVGASAVCLLVLGHVIIYGKHGWLGSDPGPAGRRMLLEPLQLVLAALRRRR